MALQAVRRKSEDDPGHEFVFGVDPDNKKQIKAWVRRIPVSVRASIVARHKGNRARFQKGAMIMDPVTQARITRDLACWAAVRWENFILRMEDQAAADLYGAQLGADVLVDTLWTAEDQKARAAARERAMEDVATLAEWVTECANDLDARAEETEAGKGVV
jgi:hypothetical protein